MDTPGLLPRVDQARNEMELLTLASMEHLPSVVLFVMDFTGKKN
jgi:nucleolar GTP-binding protein